MSPLWGPIFGTAQVAAATDDHAWLQALADVEAALARACARSGLIEPSVADEIGAACAAVSAINPGELGRGAAADGNPVIPLVGELRGRVSPSAACSVHLGATSQDIMDTASMLVAHRALAVVLAALDSSADACALLARTHRTTVMMGRTLLQQALPTTFGAVASGWGQGLDRATTRLRAVREGLAVQLGGAAGTLAALHPNGPAVRSALAAELGLADPGTIWHTERTRVAELACALGTVSGVIGKVATDIVLLAQTEVGEVHEHHSGASSAMPHKQKPIAAVTARAAAAQTPGLVATLLTAMAAELQRGAGSWHAEWQPLTALLNSTGGAAARLSTSLCELHVDTDAMERKLDSVGDIGHAPDLVDDYLRGCAR